MNTFLEANTPNVKSLFAGGESFFQVPDYQRPYSWEKEHVEQLWNDIYEAYQQDKENYFLGSLITVPKKSGRQDIVDGQQRLTTLTVLFCVLRDNYPELNTDGKTEDISVIRQKTIESFIHDSENRNRIKLNTSVFEENSPRICQSSNKNDFDFNILKPGALKDIQDKKIDKSKFEYKFLQTALTFKEKLDKLAESNETGKFVNYIGNHVHFVKITCKNEAYAIKMFETLNTRGLPLNNANLIKSGLIRLLQEKFPKNRERFADEKKKFIEDWNRADGVTADCERKSDMEDMFKLYVYSETGANPKGNTYEEMEKLSKGRNPNEIIHDFKEFCSLHKERLSNTRKKNIHCFWYLKWRDYWRAVLLAALHSKTERPDKDTFFKDLSFELRRYYYLNMIAGKTSTAIKQTSFNVIKHVKAGKDIDFIKQELDDHLKKNNILKIVLERLSSSEIDNEKWVKPLLAVIEYHWKEGEEAEFFNVFSKKIHLEHILPKGYKKDRSWGHIKDETAEQFLHSLANLTLLSGRKNITAGNKSFKNKIEIYKGEGVDKGATKFEISRKTADKFHQWDDKNMEIRRHWLLSALEETLRIDLSSIKNDSSKESAGKKSLKSA